MVSCLSKVVYHRLRLMCSKWSTALSGIHSRYTTIPSMYISSFLHFRLAIAKPG